MNVFKLYYYELKKSKKNFIILAVFALLISVMTSAIYLTGFMWGSNLSGVKKEIMEFYSRNIFPIKLTEGISIGADHIINNIDFLLQVFFLYCFFITVSILLSYNIMKNGYRKKNRSSILEAGIPVSIAEIKLAKLMTGVTIYITAVLMLFVMIFINMASIRMLLGKYAALDFNYILNLNSIIPFVPVGIKSTFYISVIFATTCIAGVQSITSIFFTVQDKRKKIGLTMIGIILLCTGFAVMCIYLFTVLLSSAGMIGYFQPINGISFESLCNIVFIVLSVTMFTADCIVTKKRLRGGI